MWVVICANNRLQYAKPPPGGVVALAKVYNFDKFVPKLLHDDESKSLVTIACAFSVSNACTQAYGSPSLSGWKTFSQPFVQRLRQALSNGYGVAVGIPVFASWALSGYSYKLPFPVPSNDMVTGYHALSAVSFTTDSSNCTERADLNVYWDASSGSLKDAGCVILRNSWGADAGRLPAVTLHCAPNYGLRRKWIPQYASCIPHAVPVVGIAGIVCRWR